MATATDVVQDFFEAFRRHDVERMADYCSEMADVHYVPFEMWGRQRALRGDGKVRTIGKVFWAGLINSFPDLSNRVEYITEDDDGNVAAEVVLTGRQAKPWGSIDNRNLPFTLRHLFVLHVDDAGLIDKISAYWDNADHYRQLGHLEVD